MRLSPWLRPCSSRSTRTPAENLISAQILLSSSVTIGLVLLLPVPAVAVPPNQLTAGESLSWPTSCPFPIRFQCFGGSYAVPSLDGSTQLTIKREVSGPVPSGGTLELHGPNASWSSSVQSIVVATMQGDGNFVAFDAGGNQVWSTNTSGHPGAFLRVDNSRFSIITPAGATIWQSAPAPTPPPPPNCTASRDCSDEFINCDQVPDSITQSVSGTTVNAFIVGGQNAYDVPPANYQVCNVNADNVKACQSIPEPPAPPPSSCITCSPPCTTPGYICEIMVNQQGGQGGVCVLNHRCMVGYHFCGGNCVPGTGTCP